MPRHPLPAVVALALLALPTGPDPGAEVPLALDPVDGKVIWVDFWASRCGPCRRSSPWMNQMLDRYGDQGLQIIGVNVDKERVLADEFLAETPDGDDYRRVAELHAMRPNTVAVAVHRLRLRLRELVREELSETVDGSEQLEQEMEAWRAALRD